VLPTPNLSTLTGDHTYGEYPTISVAFHRRLRCDGVYLSLLPIQGTPIR
jgi:hypothetical protein